ncbi:hypothetical protein CGCFRS4_v015198 [Colletotrichum fructicola]|nr:hypothetical protein CGCFRS4_v015198 [Colletotrichum fructicola]
MGSAPSGYFLSGTSNHAVAVASLRVNVYQPVLVTERFLRRQSQQAYTVRANRPNSYITIRHFYHGHGGIFHLYLAKTHQSTACQTTLTIFS